jgi:hypothetical protein
MGSTIVRYRVKPDRVEENIALVRAVYAQLAERRPDGLHYATFQLPDGVSFMHVVFETDDAGAILGAVPAFQAFQLGIAERCDEPPAPAPVTLVGSYGVGS